MSFKWLVFGTFGVIMFFAQCNATDAKNEEKQELSEEDQEEITKKLEYITMLNKELTSGKPENEQVSATALFNAASDFVNNYPEHEKTPAVMELAAKASEVIGKPQQAINIMQKLVDEFPVSADTPKYMANIARIYEEKGDIEKAKEVYGQLIEKFPEDPFAVDAKSYMENILGKSDAEILMFLDSANAEM